MVPGHWEQIVEVAGRVDVRDLQRLGWTPEKIMAGFDSRKLHGVGGIDDSVLIPRHEFDNCLIQLDIETIRKRVMALPPIINVHREFRTLSKVARELHLSPERVTKWADDGLIEWQYRNQHSTPIRRHLEVRFDDVRAYHNSLNQSSRASDVTALRLAKQLARRSRRNAGTTRDSSPTPTRE